MINVNDLRAGQSIIYDNKLYMVLEYQHVKPGKGAAFVKTKLKNLRTGANVEETFNSSLRVEQAVINKKTMQYLYKDGNNFVFMDMHDYNQLEVDEKIIGDKARFLKPNADLTIATYEGEIVDIILPEKVSLLVTKTEPAVKGNTSSNAMKDAEVETGYTIKVPIFINQDEVIVVSTSDGKYISRA